MSIFRRDIEAVFDWRSRAEWQRLWRYYQAGIVNTLFGYGAFAALIGLGVNLYLAQIASHLAGMAFNYFTFSRYAFRGHEVSVSRFIGSYAVNYLLGLAALASFSALGATPYLGGLAAVVTVSLINFLILKRFVFRVADGL